MHPSKVRTSAPAPYRRQFLNEVGNIPIAATRSVTYSQQKERRLAVKNRRRAENGLPPLKSYAAV